MPFLSSLLVAATLHAAPSTPAELVGEWRYGSVSGTTYWDSSSGAYSGHGGGQSDTLIFAKDGTYKEYAFIEVTPMAGWTTQSFTTMEGEDGKPVFSLHLGKKRMKYRQVEKED